jgi:hypothetical protein
MRMRLSLEAIVVRLGVRFFPAPCRNGELTLIVNPTIGDVDAVTLFVRGCAQTL